MLSVRCNYYIDEILSYVKYPLARPSIKKELASHMSEKMDEYLDQKYGLDDAAIATIKDMGDAKEIGTALNKQHNPFFSWILFVTNLFVIIMILMVCKTSITYFHERVFLDRRLPADSKEENLIEFKVNKSVKLEDTVIHITKVVYYYDYHEIKVFYELESLTTRFDIRGGFNLIFNILDDKGNEYIPWTRSADQFGVVTKGALVYDDFPERLDRITIYYDKYNRNFKLEIPLEKGEQNE